MRIIQPLVILTNYKPPLLIIPLQEISIKTPLNAKVAAVLYKPPPLSSYPLRR
jgi:hypothetical protein